MKRKTLTLAICFLALIAIVSVGFASWIITRPVQDAVSEGSISTETVTDNSYTLTAEAVPGSQAVIQYGKPADYVAGANDWLSNDGAEENLSYEIKLTANYYEHMAGTVYFNIFLQESAVDGWGEINAGKLYNGGAEAGDSKFATVKAAGYIAAPKLGINGAEESAYVDYSANYELVKDNVFGCEVKYNSGSGEVSEFKTISEIKALAEADQLVLSGEGAATTDGATIIVTNDGGVKSVSIEGSVYCKVKVVFGWGTAFESKNPLVYYNALEVDDNWEEAETALESINTIGTAGTAYKIIVSDSSKGSKLE